MNWHLQVKPHQSDTTYTHTIWGGEGALSHLLHSFVSYCSFFKSTEIIDKAHIFLEINIYVAYQFTIWLFLHVYWIFILGKQIGKCMNYENTIFLKVSMISLYFIFKYLFKKYLQDDYFLQLPSYSSNIYPLEK